MSISPELSQYITQARAAGMSDDVIRTELLKAGWQVTDVNEAIPPRMPSFTPVVAPEQVSIPPQTKPKRSHLGFYIIVVLLLLIGGATYFFLPQIVIYADKLMGKTAETAPVVVDDIVRPIVPVDETASWQTYRNEEYGFEFKYPIQAMLKDQKFGQVIEIDVILEKDTDRFAVSLLPLGLNSCDSFSYSETQLSVGTSSEKVVNQEGLNWRHLSYQSNAGAGGYWEDRYYLTRGELCYQAVATGAISNGSQTKDSLTKIFSTFKFISSATSTEGWKTYRNEEYGFEFLYPVNWYYGGGLRGENQLLICLNPAGVSGDCMVLVTVNPNVDLNERYGAMKKLFEGWKVTEEEVSLLGLSSKMFAVSGFEKGKEGITSMLFFERENVVYDISTTYSYEEISSQIITTFKFISQATTTQP